MKMMMENNGLETPFEFCLLDLKNR